MNTEFAAGKAPLVLVVDDNSVLRVLARTALEMLGFEVVEAAAGDEALRAFARRRPALVLLDVQMPGMDGFAVCEALRAEHDALDLPIVMLTGREDTAAMERAYEAGATDFVAKPVPWRVLGQRVRHLLRESAALAELRRSRSQLERAQRLAHMASFEIDLATRSVTASATLRALAGFAPEEAITLDALLGRVHEQDLPAAFAGLQRAQDGAVEVPSQLRVRAGARGERIFQMAAGLLFDSDGAPTSLELTVQDITESQAVYQHASFLAYHDPLTGLGNRALFRGQLDAAIARATREGTRVGVLYLDLDHFKRVNDTLGHSAGDRLLLIVAERLRRCIRSSDGVARVVETDEGLISRLGGDEFTVLFPGITDAYDLAEVARRLQRVLGEPVELDGRQVLIRASIGIAVWPLDGADSEQLLRNADAAMYGAKERGRNDFQFYSQSLNEAALRRLELEGRLRFAAERGELELHFQPRVAGASGAITGFEALLRWRDPERGMVMPGDFIAVAEETGLIVPIGDWVLRRACETVRRWDDAALPAATLSVNVSARQLRGEGFVANVRAYTRELGIDPRRLEVEITESTLVGATESMIGALAALRELGVRIAIDDFGTGYSCLGYLRTLPVDTLKVDRVFVAQIAERESERALTAAIVAMGQALGLRVVAEGVETTGQAYLLSSWGCDELQGYLISRPLPLDGIEAYWRKRIAVD